MGYRMHGVADDPTLPPLFLANLCSTPQMKGCCYTTTFLGLQSFNLNRGHVSLDHKTASLISLPLS